MFADLQSRSRLATLRDKLLPKLLSGELQLKDSKQHETILSIHF